MRRFIDLRFIYSNERTLTKLDSTLICSTQKIKESTAVWEKIKIEDVSLNILENCNHVTGWERLLFAYTSAENDVCILCASFVNFMLLHHKLKPECPKSSETIWGNVFSSVRFLAWGKISKNPDWFRSLRVTGVILCSEYGKFFTLLFRDSSLEKLE